MQTPEQTTRRTFVIGLAAMSTAGVAGCIGDDDDGDPEVADAYFDDIGIYELQLLDRAHDPHEEISYMHGDHWHHSGDFPTVPDGDNLSIGAVAYDEDGGEIDLWDEYELHAAVAPDGDDDIVSFESHGDHVHITGQEEGLTEIVFLLADDGEAAYQSDTIAVTIAHDHANGHHDDSVSEFDVIDRDEDEVTAYIHGDHWHGSLPHVHEGEHLSLGADAKDDHGDKLDIDGDHWELRVDHAHDHDHDVVRFDLHGDHVHINGEVAGETEVVFELWHDDHVEYETPPIEVEVEDH